MRYVVVALVYGAIVLGVIAVYRGELPFTHGGRSASAGLCGSSMGPLDYRWPVRPFDRQHPVRGGFGDPRTLSPAAFGADAADDRGDFSFHNGVDIAAPAGTKVYPVVSGWATVVNGDEVRVLAGHRVFQYHHIRPTIGRPHRVIAGVSVLGVVKRPANHVHLTELDGTHVVDPLTHLRPYRDHTAPTVEQVSITTVTGAAPTDRTRRVLVTAEIADAQALRVPGAWAGFPLAPAFVGAAIVDASGAVVWRRTVADFRYGEPPSADFWQVYARGTFQNFPVFGHRYYWQLPGRYVFRITRTPLDVRRFVAAGSTLEVTAEDLCGNRTTTTRLLRFAGQPPEAART